MSIEIGKTYQVNHQRKGRFTLHITSASDEWVDGVVVSGVAEAALQGNEREAGEPISIRRSLCQFTEAPGGAERDA